MKRILAILAIILMVNVAHAQFEIYAKAGINRSNITSYDMEAKHGLNIGGFIRYQISDRFMIQPELLFSMQGAKNGKHCFLKKVQKD